MVASRSTSSTHGRNQVGRTSRVTSGQSRARVPWVPRAPSQRSAKSREGMRRSTVAGYGRDSATPRHSRQGDAG